eukprot:scaffold6160_cov23-Cyclotella_meneghiniana.AAC.5
MQAQANTRRSQSLRSSKSRISFIESIAAIHLDVSREASSNRPRRVTSDGVIESELQRLRTPPRKTKSVNLPGHFQISLKNNSDFEPADSKKNRRFTYVAPPLRVSQTSDEDNSSKVTAASHRHSLKVSFSPLPPQRAHHVCRPSAQKIHPASMPASPRVCKKYNPKEYKENLR